MKLCKIYMIGVLAAVAISVSAQTTEQKQENTVHAIKVKELTLRKENLQKQIKIEDRKRNQAVNGVTAETQEALNDRQDSICLELRSQLVAVELELKEIVPDKTAAAIVGHLNQLNQNQPQSGQAAGQAAGAAPSAGGK